MTKREQELQRQLDEANARIARLEANTPTVKRLYRAPRAKRARNDFALVVPGQIRAHAHELLTEKETKSCLSRTLSA